MPPQAPEVSPLAYGVVQKGVITGATGGNLSAATGQGNTLLVYVISNSATLPTVTLKGSSTAAMTCGFWSPGHNGDWTGIFHTLNTPAGITGYSTSGIYGSAYREVSGIPANPMIYWNLYGNATAGTTFSFNGSGYWVAGDFSTACVGYDVSNSNTPAADGWTDTSAATLYGQTSYTTGTTSASGTLPASGTWDCASLTLKQINQAGTPPINWTPVGSLQSDNVTTGQGTMTVTVANAGDLLVLYTKVAINTNYLTNVSGAGVSNWTQALTGYTDNYSGGGHVQQCWIAKAVNTGSQTLTITYQAAIGTTAVERNFRAYNCGVANATYTVDKTFTANNGTSAVHTWPSSGVPTSTMGELWLGFARVPGGSAGIFRTPSWPAVLQQSANNNPVMYALNITGSTFSPQIYDTNATALNSYCSGLLIAANAPFSPPSLATSTSFPAVTGPKMAALSDNFPGTSVNAGLWTSFGTVAVSGGVLSLTDTANSTAYSGISSNAVYDLTNSAIYGCLVSAGAQYTSTQAVLTCQLDANNTVSIFVGNGLLTAQHAIAGTYTGLGNVAYNASAMKWLRLREAGGTLYYEYSADASTWTALASEADPFALTAVQVFIQEGAYATTDPAATSQWDNINVPPVNATVTPGTLAVSAAFPARTVGQGQAATPAALAVTTAFPAPGVGAGEALTPPVLATSASFPARTVNAGSALTPPVLAAAASFPAPAITTSTSVTVTPAVLATATSFPALTIRAGAGVTPLVLATAATFPASAPSGGAVVTSPALATAASFPAVSIQAGSTVTVTPPVLATPASFPPPAAAGGAGVTPAVLATGTSFAAPAVDQITPATLAVSASFPGPAVDSITPAPLAAAATFPAVTITAGTGLTVTPPLLATSASFPAVTIVAGSGSSAAPGTLSTAASFPAPSIRADQIRAQPALVTPASFPGLSVTAGSGITITPPVLAVSASFPAALVSTSETAVPGLLATAASFPAPSVRADETLTPPPLAASTTFPAPALRADAIITPPSLAVSAAFPALSVGSGAMITPATLATGTSFPAPVVGQGQAAIPGTLATAASFPAPTISAGSIATPATLATPVVFPPASVGSGTAATPGTLTTSSSFPAPVISQGQTASAGPLATAASFPAPAVTGSSSVTPPVLQGTAAFPATTISEGSGAIVPVLAVSTAFPAPAVSCSVSITPPVLAVAATFTTPGIQTAGNASATPGALITTTGFPPPVVGQGAVIIPATLATSAAFPAVTANAGATVTPAPLHGTVTFPATSVVIPATVTPPPLITTTSFPPPAVAGGANVSQPPLSTSASFPPPAIHCSSTVTPLTLAASASFPAPSIQAPANATVVLGTLYTLTSFPGPAVGGGATVPLGTLSTGTVFLPLTFSTGSSVTPPALVTTVLFVPPFMAVINTARAEIAFTATASMRVYAASGPDLDKLWRDYQAAAAVAQADANLWVEARIAGAGSGMTGSYYSDLWESDGAAQRAWHAWLEATEDWNRQLAQFAQYGEEAADPVTGGIS